MHPLPLHGQSHGPRLVFWETTGACNLRCVHCRREWDSEAPHELSTEEALHLVDQIADARWGSILVLSGGEPIMRRDLFTVLEHAQRRTVTVALATNGTLITEPLAQRLAAAGVARASISLDGADGATHDAFRGEKGSFERALQGIGFLQRAGIPVQVNATFTKRNQQDAARMVDQVRAIGAVALHVFLLVPVGCGLDLPEDIRLEPKEVEQLLTLFDDEAHRHNFEIRATCAPQAQRIRVQRAKARERDGQEAGIGLAASSKGCLAGGGIVFVDAIGRVFPCGYLPLEVGDLRTMPLADIMKQSELLASLRDTSLLKGRCDGCAYASSCGGCRARAFGTTGDLFGEEPTCPMVGPKTH
jgi:radical SAM protein with 4Fe4S-binding SPASM domain